jgi:hypothetical protein
MDVPLVQTALTAMLRRLRAEALIPLDEQALEGMALRVSADIVQSSVPPRPLMESAAPWLAGASAEFLAHKAAEGCRPATYVAYRAGLRRFAARTGNRPLVEITASDINAFLARSRHPITKRAAWIVLHRFFVWALRMRYRGDNPMEQATRPRLVVSRDGLIFTPAEARTILCRAKHTDAIGYWALALFSGLRTEEIKRLQRYPAPWALVRLSAGIIEVPSAMAKRRARVIPLLPVLRPWLQWIKRRRVPFYPPHGRMKISRLRRETLAHRGARLSAAARQNMARRSYICYRFGLPQASYGAIAAAAGNTEPTIRKYYRRTVTAVAAHEYFSLTPAACGRPP